jgi:hypothetical protein
MKHGFTLLLKVGILLISIGTLVAMIWFPQTEGRATNLDLISIYKDPFIIYIYIASIPFFIGLFQTFNLLGYLDKNKIFSKAAVKAIRNIKYCALTIIGFLVIAIFYIRLMVHGDDPAGPTMIGFVVIFVSVIIATAASVLQRHLLNSEEKLGS